MSSVSSVNPGVSDVLQILSNAGSSSLSSALSSSAVQSALQTASPGDIVQLSRQALQLQEASDLFGSQSGTDSTSLILQALNNATPEPTASSSTAATAAEAAKAEEVSALFGTNPTAGTVNFTG